jgi:hypothetical protein
LFAGINCLRLISVFNTVVSISSTWGNFLLHAAFARGEISLFQAARGQVLTADLIC